MWTFAAVSLIFEFDNMYRTDSTNSNSTSNPHPPTRDELRSWSRYVRDILVYRIDSKAEAPLDPSSLEEGQEFLSMLMRAHIDVESLRYSRVHFALEEICATGSRWPLMIVSAAEELLSTWENDFGPLKNIRADLWGPGGRLEGLVKTNSWEQTGRTEMTRRDAQVTSVPSRNWKSAWSVEVLHGPFYPMVAGHNGFHIGDWWIKRAAAFRDGIISCSTHGITADENGAYAILMTDNEELETSQENIIKYRSSQLDPGCFNLMKNASSRQLIRVLRSWRLLSKWSPKSGVRYDGLYRVSGFGVKLTADAKGRDKWQYTFTLERHDTQPGMDKALVHPTADEVDDWIDYKKDKEAFKEEASARQSKNEKRNIIGWILEGTVDRRQQGMGNGPHRTKLVAAETTR